MNYENMIRVAKLILKYDHFNMGDWAVFDPAIKELASKDMESRTHVFTTMVDLTDDRCNTNCCIAGWANFITKNPPDDTQAAAEFFDLNEDDADCIFTGGPIWGWAFFNNVIQCKPGEWATATAKDGYDLLLAIATGVITFEDAEEFTEHYYYDQVGPGYTFLRREQFYRDRSHLPKVIERGHIFKHWPLSEKPKEDDSEQ